ncbi:DUF2934 domain-containing protein [Rhodopseudomonas pseudopalustris]
MADDERLRCDSAAENFLSQPSALSERSERAASNGSRAVARCPQEFVRNQLLTSGLHRNAIQPLTHPGIAMEAIIMDSDLEQRIRHRAREKWELAGYPEDRSDEFWLEAEKEVRGEQDTYNELKSDPSVTTNS